MNGCEPLIVNFNPTPNNPNYNYNWIFSDDGISYSICPEHEFETYGEYDVSLEITDDNGCSNIISYTDFITVYENPEDKFLYIANIVNIINPTIYFDNHSYNNYSNHWIFGDGDSTDIVNPIHTYTGLGEYIVFLIVTSPEGCKDTTYSSIHVNDITTIYFPTGFSPDPDGINDTFSTEGHSVYDGNYSLSVYDRWGELIFTTTDINERWNGTVQGGSTDIVKIGIYPWLCIYKDTNGISHEITGAVTVIR